MISLGRNIRQPNDPLEKITLRQLSDKIKNPDPGFVGFINQLREVQTIDERKYRELKTRLPYAVAAVFNPPYRKIENFARTDYFILDIDHLSDKEINLNALAEKFKTDPRIVLSFRSPSADGLKLFFKLSSPFYDHGKYSLFYKVFARKFAMDYSLDQVVDKRTSDVSRACFVSYDPELWYNPNAESVNPDKYVNFEDQLQIDELSQTLKEEEKKTANQKTGTAEPTAKELPDEIIQKIREKLNPKLIEKKEKQIFVPDELNTIVELVRVNLAEYNIQIDEIVSIHYGKQFRLKLNHLHAEINVFYGKRGFSVVKSTKSGLNQELIDICYDIFNATIF